MQNQRMPHPPETLSVKLSFGLDYVPQEFDIRQRVLLRHRDYLEEIRARTGAQVIIRGRGSGEPEPRTGFDTPEFLFIHLQHYNPRALQAAQQMAEDLVKWVREDFEMFQEEQRRRGHSSSI